LVDEAEAVLTGLATAEAAALLGGAEPVPRPAADGLPGRRQERQATAGALEVGHPAGQVVPDRAGVHLDRQPGVAVLVLVRADGQPALDHHRVAPADAGGHVGGQPPPAEHGYERRIAVGPFAAGPVDPP